jgi:polysaccharide biosynthesis/export protein
MTHVHAECSLLPEAPLEVEPQLSDGELLRRFATASDAAAFETLVQRHGPMVLGVCRRVLHDTHTAEDAFQATFLVLVRKARAIRRPELLGNWLYGVAYRVASRARTQKTTTPKTTRSDHEMWTAVMPNHDATSEIERRELQRLLDEELQRLPSAYRQPLVLCYLQGKTHAEAARLLGWPLGSMASRLATARDKLRARLNRRGLSTSAGLFAAILFANTARASVPRSLVTDTVRAAMSEAARQAAASATASSTALRLARSVRREMNLHVVKIALSVLASLVAVGLLAVRTACLASSNESLRQASANMWIKSGAAPVSSVLATTSARPPDATPAQQPRRHCGRDSH